MKICGKVKTKNIIKNLEISFMKNEKVLKCDKKIINKASDYLTNLNVIIFYPEDLEIIKGSPKNRRKYIDTELSQLNRSYCIILNEFNKLLRMRNEYLKNETFDENYFEILNDYYIEKAMILYKMRSKFVDRLNDLSPFIYQDIMKIEGFHLEYRINDFDFEGNFDKQKVVDYSKKIRAKELLYKTTLFGPQRDDLEFYLGENNMKFFASQGQQRAAVLALKLSEIEIFYKNTDEKPILLLDDVFSELDKKKKNNLLKYIENNVQTIITTTDLSNISIKIKRKANLIEIRNGLIINKKEV